jgi:hypothetical protein
LPVVSWLLRGLLGLGCAALAYSAWPVAVGAWYAQKADLVINRLRDGKSINLPDALAAIGDFDRAIGANPSAGHHLDRSELLVGASTNLNWAAPDSQREQWLHMAEADLETGLAGAPPRLWPARLELILRTWNSFTDAERDRIAAYVVMTWEASSDRRWFVSAMSQAADELYLRMLLADLPGAQEELSMWIGLVRR